MFESIRLSDLPPYAKLFVGLFTALMLCVCFWAGWLYTIEKGGVDERALPPYLQKDSVKKDMNEYMTDTAEVLAPIWDSTHKGEETRVDSSTMAKDVKKHEKDRDFTRPPRFRHNLGLAHTHINGQTLLFFAIGLVFLFSSVKSALKKTTFIIFALAIVAHNIGLTGMGFASVYDDILSISGVVILVMIAYMAFIIFMDLAKKPTSGTAHAG